MANKDEDPTTVAQHMRDQAAGAAPTSRQLVFDPTTGQLAATSRPSPDAIIAANTADEGYFGSRGRDDLR
jgi:hypothetical protein